MKNYIRVFNNNASYLTKQISGINTVFQNKQVVFEELNDKCIFSIPTIDFEGKVFTTRKHTFGWRSIGVKSEYLLNGKYLIDKEESEECKIVVYYEDKIEE